MGLFSVSMTAAPFFDSHSTHRFPATQCHNLCVSLSLLLAPRTTGDVLSNLAIDHRRYPIRRLPPPLLSQKAAHLYPFSTPLPGPPPPSSSASPLSTLPSPQNHRLRTPLRHIEKPLPLFNSLPSLSLQRRRSDAGAARRLVDTRTQPSTRRPKRGSSFFPFPVSSSSLSAGGKTFSWSQKKEGKKITARPNTCDFDSSYSHEFPLASGSFPASDPLLFRLLAADRSHAGVWQRLGRLTG